jgi:hypothetical protein
MARSSTRIEDDLPTDVGAEDDVEPDDEAVAGEFVGSSVQDDEGVDLSEGPDGVDPATDDADEGSAGGRS